MNEALLRYESKETFLAAAKRYRQMALFVFIGAALEMLILMVLQLVFVDELHALLDSLLGPDRQTALRGAVYAAIVSPPMILAMIWMTWYGKRRSDLRCSHCSISFANALTAESVVKHDVCPACDTVVFQPDINASD